MERREFVVGSGAALALAGAGGLASAQGGFQEGRHYVRLSQPAPVSVPAGKIEVVEFFWYGCPHCWPRISCSVFYEDPARAIDWLVAAFGFEVRLKIVGEGGRIEHSQLTLGEGLIFVGGAGAANTHPDRTFPARPKALGDRNTQALCIFVDAVDGHCAHARQAGARIEMEPTTTDHGAVYWTDRSYLAVDPEGHRWWFMQRLRTTGQ